MPAAPSRRPTIAALIACVLAGTALVACSSDPEAGGPTVTATPAPVEEPAESADASPTQDPEPTGPPEVVETLASGLAVPWGIDFLPDDSAIVTERDSRRLLRITPDGGVTELGVVEAAVPQGEAGLLGVAVSPTYDEDASVFLYVTTAEDNRVLRASVTDTGLGETEVVLDGIPNGFIHDGGRLAFGPDGFLYVSTGEVGESSLAQDRDSLAGKILRITTDGEAAPGNPVDGSPVWSWGHRNVQGLAFDDEDRLWASEFGDSTWDEVNRIEPGSNYGWPQVEGEGNRDEFVDPQVVWPTSEASPSGLAFLDGHLWLGALRGQRLWRIDVEGDRAQAPRDFFVGDYGRLRTVVTSPDGRLWVTTSNQDGRGTPAEQDDRILVVDPSSA